MRGFGRAAVLICGFLAAGPAFGARVILKDGTILEGKIIAETDGDILMKTSPVSRSRLISNEQILSVTRDPVPAKVRDPQRYGELELGLTGSAYSGSEISMDPSAGLHVGGGLRFHPVFQVNAMFDWQPALTGSFAATDGTTLRSYEHFSGYGGGFGGQIFPFYRLKTWKVEPYLMGGYAWHQLAPKDSGDNLHGAGFHIGTGAAWPIGKNLFVKTAFLYERVSYPRMFFLMREGTLDPPVVLNAYALALNLAWRL